jgi:ABC-2 type transport system ATP-binding protein
MLEARELSRQYGSTRAVDEVSFGVEAGEVVGLLGPNGAGKTTVMKMLTGFLEPTSGQVLLDGKAMAAHRRSLQRRIGYLPENCPIYPDMTVVDYLDYQAVLHGVPASERPGRVRDAIRRAALDDYALAPVSALSRGYRQRTGVAQAILHGPDVVILDEPTNGLDPEQIREMRRLIRSLAEHAAVLVSTHILQEVQAVCDRVLMLRQGRLALDSRLDELGGSNRLLVSVDAALEDVRGIVGDLTGVDGIEDLAGDGAARRYAVATRGEASELAPQLARRLQDAGLSLYALSPETRDLETIFAEVNSDN